MPYDSPATIRRRQVAAESKSAKGKRTRKAAPKILTDAEWATTCDFHIEAIINPISADNAGAHACALVTMAIERRAAQIQRDSRCTREDAISAARIELLDSEIPSSEGSGEAPVNGAGSFGKQTVTRISDALIASGKAIPLEKLRWTDYPLETRLRGLRLLLDAVRQARR
jgi:hypothetical protein